MKNYLELEISKIKNITELNMEIPREKGLYSIVGNNGSGKSTIMLALSQLVRKSSLTKLSPVDFDNESYIRFNCGKEDHWYYNKELDKWFVNGHSPFLHFDGFYEGSIFYGTRFSDAVKAESKMEQLSSGNYIVDADEYIIEKLSMIMHGDKEHYKELKRIRNREIAKKFGFSGMPYFYQTPRGLISQIEMSSGECMLITLLHFVYNVLVRNNYKKGNEVLFLIDEVELALHPKAINRLISLMEELTQEYKLITVFSSHSAEVIRRINPKNIFQIENNDGIITVNNPCYPSYAIRDLYTQDGYDYLILVEDDLAKKFVNRIIDKNDLFYSKLIHVLPAGNWYNTLRLHDDIIKNNVLGISKQVISIIDGDVKDEVLKKEEFTNLKKLFLPIKSIEKFLLLKLVNEKDSKIIRLLGDKYFRSRSIQEITSDYVLNFDLEKDKNGKKLYNVLISNLIKVGITEEQFLNSFCEDLLSIINTDHFESQLSVLIT